MSFPLIVEWSGLLKTPAMNQRSRLSTDFFIQLFGSLSGDQINRSPYDRLTEDFFPSPCPYGVQLWMSGAFTSILCMERVFLHDPLLGQNEVALQQYHGELREKHRKYLASKKNQSRQGSCKKDWSTIHKVSMDAWNQRATHLVHDRSSTDTPTNSRRSEDMSNNNRRSEADFHGPLQNQPPSDDDTSTNSRRSEDMSNNNRRSEANFHDPLQNQPPSDDDEDTSTNSRRSEDV